MTPQTTPPAIKEAAQLLADSYPLEYQSPVYSVFITGATHPETVRHYDNDIILFTEWMRVKQIRFHPVKEMWYFYEPSSLDIPNYYNTRNLLQLYREQTTKNKEG